jgi:uncharacterized protein (TIGR03790 family)
VIDRLRASPLARALASLSFGFAVVCNPAVGQQPLPTVAPASEPRASVPHAAPSSAEVDAVPEAALPNLSMPRIGLRASDIAVVVNDADPTSVELGTYYAQQRGLSAQQIVHVRFTPGVPTMSAAEFDRVQAELKDKVPAQVQAYALAWTAPYRVECMSITSAFAFGFDAAYCAQGCQTTKTSPYFDSGSHAPHTDLRLRPAMLLAAHDLKAAKALVDRGVRSDLRWPAGTGYLVSTSDLKRNVRAQTYPATLRALVAAYPLKLLQIDELVDRSDVMFYFTGLLRVDGIERNRYLDGAVADHLTSLGGMLTDSPQMSALDWISAGATGSYGAVTEPCNFREKFPEPAVLMAHYLSGETLIESYWKSVRMPGQGVFIGEPLARPFGGMQVRRVGAEFRLRTRGLRPGNYLLQSARSPIGPFRTGAELSIPGVGVRELRLPADSRDHFRVVMVPGAVPRPLGLQGLQQR